MKEPKKTTREERLEGLVHGKVMRNHRGQYLLIQRALSDIEPTPGVECVRKGLSLIHI